MNSVNNNNNGNRQGLTNLRIEFAKMQAEFQGITAKELIRLADEVSKLRTDFQDLKLEFATHKTEMLFRSGVWGAIAGAIPAAIAIIWLLSK